VRNYVRLDPATEPAHILLVHATAPATTEVNQP
jgi:hypothetical protein